MATGHWAGPPFDTRDMATVIDVLERQARNARSK